MILWTYICGLAVRVNLVLAQGHDSEPAVPLSVQTGDHLDGFLSGLAEMLNVRHPRQGIARIGVMNSALRDEM